MADFCAWGQEPYPDDSPVLLLYDMDLGWIVEAVNDGEYEVQNLHEYSYMKGTENHDEHPDFEFAIKEAKERGVRVRYYHDWEHAKGG